MGSEEEEAGVEQAAAARRERLRALKAAQELLDTPDDENSVQAQGNDGLEEANGNDTEEK